MIEKVIYSEHHKGLKEYPLMGEPGKTEVPHGWTNIYDYLNDMDRYKKDLESYDAWLSSPPIAIVRDEDIEYASVVRPISDYEMIDSNKWFLANCEKCGWQGSSEKLLGGGQIADTGDYGDCYCPKCESSKIEEVGDFPSYVGIVAIPIKEGKEPKMKNIPDKEGNNAPNKVLLSEQILCAAIWYKDIPLQKNFDSSILRPVNTKTGLVFCGYRHPHCMYTMIAVTGLRSIEKEVGRYVQGFLTSKNRFVNRMEAAEIHKANGGVLNYSSTELYSEDLYSLNNDLNAPVSDTTGDEQGDAAGIKNQSN